MPCASADIAVSVTAAATPHNVLEKLNMRNNLLSLSLAGFCQANRAQVSMRRGTKLGREREVLRVDLQKLLLKHSGKMRGRAIFRRL